MEELIKKHKGDKAAEDRIAYQQLSEMDQERVGEVLQKVGIVYPQRQRWNSKDDFNKEEEKLEELNTQNKRSGSMVDMAGKVGHNIKKKFSDFKKKIQAFN